MKNVFFIMMLVVLGLFSCKKKNVEPTVKTNPPAGVPGNTEDNHYFLTITSLVEGHNSPIIGGGGLCEYFSYDLNGNPESSGPITRNTWVNLPNVGNRPLRAGDEIYQYIFGEMYFRMTSPTHGEAYRFINSQGVEQSIGTFSGEINVSGDTIYIEM